MGACCSSDKDVRRDLVGIVNDDRDDEFEGDGGGEGGGGREGDLGARARLRGSNDTCCMFTKQGRKGINQDTMTVWEVNLTTFASFVSGFILFSWSFFFSWLASLLILLFL